MSLNKVRMLNTALISYQNFSNDRYLPENLTPSEYTALQHLAKRKNIDIQKPDSR